MKAIFSFPTITIVCILICLGWTAEGQDLRLGQLIGHKGEISQLAFTPDGKYLFSSSKSDQKIFMWDVESGKLINSSPQMAVNNMIISPTGEYVATTDYLGYLWNVRENTTETVSDDFEVAYFTGEGSFLLNRRNNYPYTIYEGEVAPVNTEFSKWEEIEKYVEYNGRLYGSNQQKGFWNIKANIETTGDTILILKNLIDEATVTSTENRFESVFAINNKKGIYAIAKTNNTIEIKDLDTDKILRVCEGHVNKWITGKYNYPHIEVVDQNFNLKWNLVDNSQDKQASISRPKNQFDKTDSRPADEDWYNPLAFHSQNKEFTVTCLPWWRDEARQRGYELINNKNGSYKSLEIDKWLRQLGISDDGQFLIAVTEQYKILLYNTFSEEIIGEFDGHQGTDFSSVSFTPDGHYVFTTGKDGSMILIDLINPEIALTFFIIGDTDWLVTTPSGLFDASPATMNLMYYVKDFEVIEFEQLKERYYEPGLFNKIMSGQDLRDAEVLDDLDLYPIIEANITDHVLNVKLSERNGGIGRLSLFINGKEVEGDINPDRNLNVRLDLGNYSKYIQVNVKNSVSLRSWNKSGWLKSAPFEMEYSIEVGGVGDMGPGFAVKPSLYALIIGTSDYSGEDLDLKYADKDAEYMFKAISESGRALFGTDKTNIKLLTSESADPANLSSKENIKNAFQPLQRIGANDVLIIYFSGHGISYKDQFYYLTKDVASSEAIDDPSLRESYAISTEELTSWLTSIPAQKQVLILDACSSGNFVTAFGQTRNVSSDQIRALDRMKDRTGMYVLAGSASDKVSYEASQYGQGVLTYSLLSGMKGRALRNNEFIDVSTLFQFALDEVPVLARDIGGIQKPSIFYPANASSFDIGIVNDQVEIPLEDVKPVFELSDFEEEESWDDLLKIGKAVDDYLDELANTDTRSLVFIPAKNIKQAYRIIGKYRVFGEDILLRCKLLNGNDNLGSFEINGNKSELSKLISQVIDKSFQLAESHLTQ